MALTITIESAYTAGPTTGVINHADSITGWAVDGSGGAAFDIDTEIYYQGTACMSAAFSSGKYGLVYYTVPTAMNFTTTYVGEHVLIWWQVTTIGASDPVAETIPGPGYSIRIGNSPTVYREWVLGGNDGTVNKYTGGWQCAVIDPNVGGRDVGGFTSPTAISIIGLFYSGLTASRSSNMFIDSIMVGKGLRITGTETVSGEGWDEVVTYCTDRANRAYGFVQEKEPGIYSMYGTMFIGDGAANTVFTGSGKVLKWGDYEYFSNVGTLATSTTINSTFHGLTIDDNATFTTVFQDGVAVGADAGRAGSTFIGSDATNTTFLLATGANAASTTKFYNTTFNTISGGLTWINDADHLMYSATVTKSGEFNPVGAPKIRNCIFSETTATSPNAALQWNTSIDITDCNFISNANAIQVLSTADQTYNALFFTDNTFDTYLNNGDVAIDITNTGNSNATTSSSTGTAVVTYISGKILTITNLQPDSEVRIFTDPALTALGGVERVGLVGTYDTGFSAVSGQHPDANGRYSIAYSYNYTVDTDIFVVVHSLDYQYLRLSTTLVAVDSSLQVNQNIDRQYDGSGIPV
jgi:hypothetical protein